MRRFCCLCVLICWYIILILCVVYRDPTPVVAQIMSALDNLKVESEQGMLPQETADAVDIVASTLPKLQVTFESKRFARDMPNPISGNAAQSSVSAYRLSCVGC